jgi:nucleotide-binding universal stress UspA family protein
MMKLQHILFPYDFSAPADRIASHVEALARATRARVTLVSVIPPAFDPGPPGIVRAEGAAGADPAQELENVQRQLDKALAAEMSDVAITRIVVRGDPAIQIAAFVDAHDVDLVMMPTHGLGVFRRFLVGSVTAKVLHDATCPVWTAVHLDAPSSAPLPRRIICAIDNSQPGSDLARWAVAFAGLVGAQLTLLHVVEPVTDWPANERERQLQEQVRDYARRSLEARFKSSGVDVPLRLVVGRIVETVVEQARADQTDLVIVGRGSVAEPFGRLRTHAFAIIQHSPCPVVSV